MAEKGVVCGSKMVRVLMILLASGLAVYTVAPAVYWHVLVGAEEGDVSLTKWVLQCPPCPLGFDTCKGLPASVGSSASKLTAIAQKLNLTLRSDLQGCNQEVKDEIGKSVALLLREGLKLQKEAKAAQQRANTVAYLDASKKAVFRNSKGRLTSEKGTIRGCAQAEADLAKETVRANLWEKRAKDLGWKSKPGGYQKYKKYIQMLDGGA